MYFRMSKREKRNSTFNKHLKSAVETVLMEPDVDLQLLKNICFTSGIEGQSLRSVVWKILLGYLPPKKDEWEKKV